VAVDSNGAEFVGNKFNHKQTNIKNTQLTLYISTYMYIECVSR